MPGGKALHASQRLARALEQLWVRLNRRQHLGRLVATAEQLQLHSVQLPRRMLQVHGNRYHVL